jgi:hypothetical protein
MGKHKKIVGGSRVVTKDGKCGQVVGIKFYAKTYRATMYQIAFDKGLVNWVNSSEVFCE